MGRVDDVGFTDFVRSHSPALLRTAYLLMGDLGYAEDLLQIALTKSYLAWGRIRDPRAVEAYVRRVLVTTATSWWRAPRWRWERPGIEEVPTAVGVAWTEEIDERDRVWSRIQKLPPRQRAVVVLRYYEDLTEAETAKILGCTVGTVKAQAHRALRRLRTTVSADDHPAGSTSVQGTKEET